MEELEKNVFVKELLGIAKRILNNTEYKILLYRYPLKGTGLTQEEVGKIFHIPKSRVNTLQRRALKKLRKFSDIQDLFAEANAKRQRQR